jgi:phenylacetate-CoA ligase
MSDGSAKTTPSADPDDPLALAEYAPGGAVALTDAERWPTLDAAGAARLDAVVRHPLAPAWVHRTGDRLSADGVARVLAPLPVHGWLAQHLATARKLPAYRRVAATLGDLPSWPTVTREDLLDDVSAFVPLDADLDRMIEGSSSGTTGRALQIPNDIEEVARSFHLLVRLVAEQGIDWRPDPGRMALAYVVHQRQAFTYTSSISSFGQATMARLNLHPSEWPAAGQRTGFLLAQQPQVITGNPTSLAELLHPDLVAGLAPLALFSGAMALSAPLRRDLEKAYDCPVLDVYGLHETRPIAVSADGGPFVVLDRRVHVEVLDADGRPASPAERGEIVVTAGENPLLPLVRYRTGDFARLVHVNGRPALVDLEGREATRFVDAAGALVPCVDLTQHLQAGGAHGWAVHQAANGTVAATVVGGDADRIGTALRRLLGRPVTVATVATLLELGEGKPRRYRSEVPGA